MSSTVCWPIFRKADSKTMSKPNKPKSKNQQYFTNEDWLPQISEWKGLKTAIEVTSERIINWKIQSCTQYYICSRIASAKQFAKWIRGQWSIENNLHWVADVVFREDDATNRVGHSTENLTLVRRLVMNMVNLFDPSVGLAAARRFATHEPDYLKGMLIKVFRKNVKSF